MRISLEWLQQYVEIRETPEQMKADLTMLGLVVETIDVSGGTPVLEMEVTSNRPDCLNHLGVAREAAAFYRRELRLPAVKRSLRLRRERTPYVVEILDPELCPRYCGLLLDGIRIGPSPEWMQRRLDAAGMRPVNNVVDLTNYVLLELGHPLHAFDFRKLRGGKIVVARAQEGQKITTLDGVERSLDSEMLLINDAEGPVAVAGVMGGLESEIGPGTKTVLLECAYFKPASVRRTAKRLGLSTEASYRFERGADWGGTVHAIARACLLAEEIAGARIAGSLQDCYPKPMSPVEIELARPRAEALLGVPLDDSFVESALARLHFKTSRKGRGVWSVACPSYRADMELEADLIEEVARVYGYEKIPITVPPAHRAGLPSPVQPYEEEATRLLLGLGYSEAVNLSFAAEEDHAEFAPLSGERVAIRNPLTEETRFMRTTLTAGLVRALRHNLSRDVLQVRLFEIGKIYPRGEDGRPVERRMIGLAGTGSLFGRSWASPAAAFGFPHLKGAVEELFRGLRCAPFTIRAGADVPWLDPACAATLEIGGNTAGVLGALHPSLEETLKLRQPVFLAELEFERHFADFFSPIRYEPLPRHPAVERDISVLIPTGIAYETLRKGILDLGIPELAGLELIDVYEGEKIPEGKLSVTLRFTFLDPERTLTVDRIQAFYDNILNHLRTARGAELR